jgi:hypothetical protein
MDSSQWLKASVLILMMVLGSCGQCSLDEQVDAAQQAIDN